MKPAEGEPRREQEVADLLASQCPAPPDDLVDRVMAALPDRVPRGRFPRVAWLAPALAGAAAGLLKAGGPLTTGGQRTGGGTQQ